MTINYSDGRAVEAALLSRTENAMRVAVQGGEDVMEFREIRGSWVSADCEPVTIEFAWQRRERKPTVTEADCHCSHDLAARLIGLLFTDSADQAPAQPRAAAVARVRAMAAPAHSGFVL